MNLKNTNYVELLALSPHIEGGYYRVEYDSEEKIQREHLPPRFSGKRNISGEHSLVSAQVSPGFIFDDLEIFPKSVLLEKYPQHHTIIDKLCRS